MDIYTVVLVGCRSVGKTTYLNRLMNGFYNDRYLPTPHRVRSVLRVDTTQGEVCFNVIEIPGYPTREDILKCNPDGMIIMFDRSNYFTFNMVTSFIVDDLPTVICANKSEPGNYFISNMIFESLTIPCISKVDISTKMSYNLVEPFLDLLQEFKD